MCSATSRGSAGPGPEPWGHPHFLEWKGNTSQDRTEEQEDRAELGKRSSRVALCPRVIFNKAVVKE